jgi:hypothetical protein
MTTIADVSLFVIRLLMFLIVLKSITIGSDFNFILWFKYKKQYTDWYNNRPKFKS